MALEPWTRPLYWPRGVQDTRCEVCGGGGNYGVLQLPWGAQGLLCLLQWGSYSTSHRQLGFCVCACVCVTQLPVSLSTCVRGSVCVMQNSVLTVCGPVFLRPRLPSWTLVAAGFCEVAGM